MTNSHNRTMGGRNSERNNASPHQYTGSYYSGSSRKQKGQKSPSNNKFFTSSISPTNSLSSSPPRLFGNSNNGRPISGNGATGHNNHHYFNNNNNNNNNNHQYNNYSSNSHHYQHHSQSSYGCGGASSPSGLLTGVTSLASSPPNITLFAGSKCYDAPSPNALPRPPRHWTLCSVAAKRSISSTKSAEFSNNLKMLLNVQA